MIDVKAGAEKAAWVKLAEAFERLQCARKIYADQPEPHSEHADNGLSREAAEFVGATKTWIEALESFLWEQDRKRGNAPPYPAFGGIPTSDELEGMAWWNRATPEAREHWLEASGKGPNASAADAWATYKKKRD